MYQTDVIFIAVKTEYITKTFSFISSSVLRAKLSLKYPQLFLVVFNLVQILILITLRFHVMCNIWVIKCLNSNLFTKYQ